MTLSWIYRKMLQQSLNAETNPLLMEGAGKWHPANKWSLCVLLCTACSCSSSEASFMSAVGAGCLLSTMESCSGKCPLHLSYGAWSSTYHTNSGSVSSNSCLCIWPHHCSQDRCPLPLASFLQDSLSQVSDPWNATQEWPWFLDFSGRKLSLNLRLKLYEIFHDYVS